jgi:SpoVK/Ycf46/Vps4 family AAA+-type ATPase
MAERTATVLMVATANDISALPPELIRKGRFDEIFFVDLPSDSLRETVFQIHLKKRGLDPAAFKLEPLVAASTGFSGAEIEQSVVAALYAAHAQKQPPATTHVLRELARTRPLSIIMAERVQELRHWAGSRTVPAD